MIIKLLPEAYHKQLANIKKTQERKKRAAIADKHSKTQPSDKAMEGDDSTLLQSVKKSQPERYCCSSSTRFTLAYI